MEKRYGTLAIVRSPLSNKPKFRQLVYTAFVSHSKDHNSFVKNMYPGLEPVVEVDQEELAKKYANCLKLIHLGNYLCTPKVDYSNERKCMLDLEGPNFIVVELRSKKKSQKDSGIFVF